MSYIGTGRKYFEVSDVRLKEDVTSVGSVLDKVMILQPKSYKNMRNENEKDADRISTGFLAQKVIPLFPDLVSDFTRDGKDSAIETL
jgi:hypothetical protein